MTISRYKETNIIINDDLDYKKVFKTRYERKNILRHFETQTMDYPDNDEIRSMNFVNHSWKMGDRYYKLAHKYYGDSKYWWLIAWFNKKPTEQHVKNGDLIKVPTPLRDALDAYGL